MKYKVKKYARLEIYFVFSLFFFSELTLPPIFRGGRCRHEAITHAATFQPHYLILYTR